jgi:hypothetical protein
VIFLSFFFIPLFLIVPGPSWLSAEMMKMLVLRSYIVAVEALLLVYFYSFCRLTYGQDIKKMTRRFEDFDFKKIST